MCTHRWIVRLLRWANVFPQSLHLYSLFPMCTRRRWSVRWLVFVNVYIITLATDKRHLRSYWSPGVTSPTAPGRRPPPVPSGELWVPAASAWTDTGDACGGVWDAVDPEKHNNLQAKRLQKGYELRNVVPLLWACTAVCTCLICYTGDSDVCYHTFQSLLGRIYLHWLS